MAGRASVGVRGRRPRGAGHRCRGRCGRLRYGECRAWCRVMKWRSPTCPQRRPLRALHAGEMPSNTELRLGSRSSKKRQRCGRCLPINVRALRSTFPRNSVLTPHHSRGLRINLQLVQIKYHHNAEPQSAHRSACPLGSSLQIACAEVCRPRALCRWATPPSSMRLTLSSLVA